MNMINPAKTESSERYLVVVGAFLTLVSLGVVISSYGVFFKPLSNEFGWNRGDTSGPFSAAMIISGLMALAAGRLADRFSARWTIIICGVLLGSGCLLLSQTNSLYQLFLYFGVIAGCGMSVMVPTTSLITRTFKRQRGLMTGITQSGASTGSVIAAPLITVLISAFNWRTSYIVLGIMILVFTAVALVLLRDPLKESPTNQIEDAAPKTAASGGLHSGLWSIFGSGRFWVLGMILFCAGFAQSVIAVHIIPYATDIGISPIGAAFILSVMWIAMIAGNFLTGKAHDILGGSASMIIALSIITLGIVALLIGSQLWVFYVMAALMGIGFGGAVTLRSLSVAELFGLQGHGLITGAIMLIYTAGCACGPVIAGYTFDISHQYQLVFILTLVVCIFGLGMACLLKLKFSGSKTS